MHEKDIIDNRKTLTMRKKTYCTADSLQDLKDGKGNIHTR